MSKNFRVLALAGLLAIVSTASASTELSVGNSYNGLIDLGSMGSRKQIILPETIGKWVLIEESETPIAPSSTRWAGTVPTKMGDYSWLEVANGVPRTLLQVRTTTKPAADAAWPNVCKTAPETVYKNEFFRGALKEKCLLVDTVPAASLSNREKSLLGERFKSAQTLRPLRATMTIYNRYDGFLEVTVSALTTADGSDTALPKALVNWSEIYATILEDAIRHGLDYKAIPPVPSADAPFVVTTTPAQSPAPIATPKNVENDVFEKLEKLKSLRDKGIITDEEFNQKKQELLKRL